MKVILVSPVRGVPRPWLHFHVETVMVNVVDILRVGPRHRETLMFDGELWVDSGGYQALKKGLKLDLKHVRKIYGKLWDAARLMSFDVPPSPSDPRDEAERKFRASLRNYRALRRALGDRVIPVLHVYRDGDLVMRYLAEYEDAEHLAVGGAVPYVLTGRGVKGGRRHALSLIAEVRDRFPGRLHLLGMGSPIVTGILEGLGVDSTDSATWRLKAAYGKVLLPGGGERHVTGRPIRFGKKEATDGDLKLLEDFLRGTGFPMLGKMGMEEMLGKFEYRALINAWVVLKSREPPRNRAFKSLAETLLHEVPHRGAGLLHGRHVH